MELTSKNLYDYLSKHNANQRKLERLLDFFNCDEDSLNKLLNSGEAMGIFIYDDEDGWRTQEFTKIDSKKFFDFIFAGVTLNSSEPKHESSKKPETKTHATPSIKTPVRSFAKHTLKPGIDKAGEAEASAVEAASAVKAEASSEEVKPAEPAEEEEIVQKEFLLRGLYKLILRRNEHGTSESLMQQYYKIDDIDLRFVLDYLEHKNIFRRDSQSRWYANPEKAKDPMIAKTLIGLRNSAILNNEFKKKAMRGGH